jgi:hypothetical protein
MSLCGLDFGTSNSTVVVVDKLATMVPLEQHPRTGELETIKKDNPKLHVYLECCQRFPCGEGRKQTYLNN